MRAGHDGPMAGDLGRELIGSIADVLTGADDRGPERVLARLSALSGREWLRLDEAARLRSPWHQSPLDRVPDWRPLLAAGQDQVAAIAASMSRDGRVREAAIAVLAGMPGSVPSAALAVRTADWVPQVSSAAAAALVARVVPGDLDLVVPVMLALTERRRGRLVAGGFLAGVAAGPAATLAALTAGGQRAARLWALDGLARRDLLTAETLVDLAIRDGDPVVALWCARQLTSLSDGLSAEAGARLLASARGGVRAFAVQHVPDVQLPRDALRRLLLDKSGAVRSMARWRWTQRWGSPAPVYLDALTVQGRPSALASALEGLDETSDGSLPTAAVPFLTHPSPKVRRAAVQAVGRRGGPGDILGYLAPMLQDDSNRVVTAALRNLRGYTLPPGALADLDEAGTARSRRTALSVRQRLGSWERVRADLRAMNGRDPDLVTAARADLLAWLQHGAATAYGRPDADQAAEIAKTLGTGQLTDRQRREIAFVAGIGTVRLVTDQADGTQPDAG